MIGALRTLAANLVIGAALCRADRLARHRGIAWSPGCGRRAP